VDKCYGDEQKCKSENQIIEKLNSELAAFAMPFEDEYWFSKVSAARALTGTFRSFNTFTSTDSSSVYLEFDTSNQVLSVAVNC
jgi:hypothetical protein